MGDAENRDSRRYYYRTVNAPADFWSWELFREGHHRVAWGVCAATRAAAQGEARRCKEYFIWADGQMGGRADQ